MNTRVRGQNLTYSIANHIGIAIVTGVYSADNPIPIEAELCRAIRRQPPGAARGGQDADRQGSAGCTAAPRHLGAARRQLESARSGRARLAAGAQIFPGTADRVHRDALAVEPGAATLAAALGRPGRESRHQSRIERMQAADRGEDDPLDSDIAFHVAVLRASRNRFYAQLTGFISTALRFSIRMTNRYKGVRLASVADHKKVADAIIAGKAGRRRSHAQADPGSAGPHLQARSAIRDAPRSAVTSHR